MRKVVIAGVGIHPFGRFPQKDYRQLGREAVVMALKDANVEWKDIQGAFVGNVMAEMAAGHNILQPLGVTGIPIINIENACASSGSSLRLAYEAIRHGIHDIALVVGVEKAPRGFVANSGYDRWQMWTGLGVNPIYFAMQAQEHMIRWGTTVEQLAKVSVKNHRNAVHNPYAMYRKEVSLEEVINSKRVCDPLTLLMLCAPNEGAAAAVLCAEDVVRKFTSRYVEVAAAELCTRLAGDMFVPAVSVPVGLRHASLTQRAAAQAYEAAGIGPEDLDLVELQDTDVGSEIVYMEGLGLCAMGEAGKLIDDGATESDGRIPVNVSGGLLSKGEPLGASSLGQIVEVTWQLRGDAGPRQLRRARVGLSHSEGAGGNCSVIILKKRVGWKV
ncbi:thiolase family protein [Castellaniella sp. GW247-6E4]|uniref:thiolase family protein n=1 Tax=Castellaniella sp. GW247-6E4 TaxID=3140380 RepID=UPI0033149214